MSGLGHIDLIIILAYLSVVIYMGVCYARHKHTRSVDYFLADRSMRWPFVGASIFASNVSVELYVAYASGAYALGWTAGAAEIVAGMNLVILAVLFIPFFFRSKIFTTAEFLEKRFNPTCRAILSIMIILLNLFARVGVALWAGALIMKAVAGWNMTMTIWVVGTLTAVYTLFGGLRAVIYTDSVQTVIMIVGGAALTILSLHAVGGWSAMAAALPAQHMHWANPLDHPDLPWTAFTLPWIFAGTFNWCLDQTMVQRVFGAKSLDDGRKAAIFAGHLKIWFMFTWMVPGLCCLVLFPNLADPDEAYATMAMNILPIGLRGLVFAAILAALMSTLSSALNSTATLFVRDIWLMIRPKTSELRQIHIGWVVVALMSLAAMLFAPLMAKVMENIWTYIMRVSFYCQMPIIGIFILGICWKRATGLGALMGIVVGMCISVICLLDDFTAWEAPLINNVVLQSFPHRGFMILLIGLVIVVTVSLLFSEKKERPNMEELTINWKNPQLLSAEPGPLWKDWRTWLVLLLIVDLYWYFKLF